MMHSYPRVSTLVLIEISRVFPEPSKRLSRTLSKPTTFKSKANGNGKYFLQHPLRDQGAALAEIKFDTF